MSTAGQPSFCDSRGKGRSQAREHSDKLPATNSGDCSTGNYGLEENFSEFCHPYDDWKPYANTSDPASHTIQKDSIKPKRRISQPLQQQFTPPQSEELFPRSVENHAEASKPDYLEEVHMTTSLYTDPLVRHYPTGNPMLMQDISYHNRSLPQPVQSSRSKYEPYRGRFDTPKGASRYRKEATRFDRKPYRPPHTDHTIAEVERDRIYHVERIYNAMTSGDAARDNKGSIAMKRWVHSAYYNSGLVEAYAHKVFDCLLLQAKEGFRGWIHNDYVADDRKGEDEDRNVACEDRLESILRALREEKTICEDVMNSACQIRMFVNAPKAYANRKYQNRVGNSKRGKPKDSEASITTSKARKFNPKAVTRARRNGSSLSIAPSPHARHPSQPPEMSTNQRFATPPALRDITEMTGPPRSASMQDSSRIQGYMNAMSPPALSHGHHSTPLSPENMKLIHDPNIASWPVIQQYGGTYYTGDEPLLDQPWSSPDGQQGRLCTNANANLFSQHPELAQISLSPRKQLNGAYGGMDIPEYWEAQPGVQQFPYRQSTDGQNPS